MEGVQPVVRTFSNTIPCFDIEEIKNDCVPIYLGCVIHFFDDDQCAGNLQPLAGRPPLKDTDAYQAAENLINEVNYFFSSLDNNDWNQLYHYKTDGSQWWGPWVESDDSCFPIRMTLEDVLIHRNTNDRYVGLNGADYLRDKYGVDLDNTINIFIAEVNGPNRTSGVADDIPGTSFVQEHVDLGSSAGLFVHELGHVLDLYHTHGRNAGDTDRDDCNDTWTHGYVDFDEDGDGIDERRRTCWDNTPINSNGDDLCDPNLFDPIHPCCNWHYQNNNVMTYSAWGGNPTYAALTDCQLDRMLDYIALGNECHWIRSMGDQCPPPQSVIGAPCSDFVDGDCKLCLKLEASSNENYYKLEFFEVLSDGSLSSVRNSGWLMGPSNTYCIDFDNNILHGDFSPNTQYSVSLTTVNICGDEDVQELEFMTPEIPAECNPVAEDDIPFEVFPNPFGLDGSGFTLEVEVPDNGMVDVYKSDLNSAAGILPLVNGNYFPGSIQTFSIDASAWPSGYHTLFMADDYRTHTLQVIKTQ